MAFDIKWHFMLMTGFVALAAPMGVISPLCHKDIILNNNYRLKSNVQKHESEV